MGGRLVAVLDADVLVPILSCDLLLCAFDHGLYQPVVTGRILAEVERTLAADFDHLDPAAINRRSSQVAQALAFHTHPETGPTDAVAAVNVKDRRVDELIATMVAKRVRRPITRAEVIGQLARSFPRFAAKLNVGG